MIDLNHCIEKAKELGASKSAGINTSDIQFSETFRDRCKQNTCGHYGTNWMCPPAIKSFEECNAEIMECSGGFLFQSIYTLEDSFDFDGMVKAQEIHEKTFRRILDYLHQTIDPENFLALNVGDCKICETCTYPDEECRFPDKAVASVEAYCIDVNALLTRCDLSYNNGPNTVSFVGMFLF
jgi:predicted metal-binding protein